MSPNSLFLLNQSAGLSFGAIGLIACHCDLCCVTWLKISWIARSRTS